jgi:hypothetical protein
LLHTYRTTFAIGALVLVACASAQTDYSSETTFKSAINSDYFLETFSTWTFGSPLGATSPTYADPGNSSYAWTATGSEPAGGYSSSPNLYSVTQGLSTDSGGTDITITFGNSPKAVTAFGGLFYTADIAGNPLAGTVDVKLNNGHTVSFSNPNGTNFYGYTGPTAITSILIHTEAPSSSPGWVELQHFYVGTTAVVPEPVSILGALAGLALLRRKSR